jgi:hypothetical protein
VANVSYSALLHHASVTDVGGSQHVIEWRADTPGNADTVLQMAEQADLPVLPDRARLPSAARARVIGCS